MTQVHHVRTKSYSFRNVVYIIITETQIESFLTQTGGEWQQLQFGAQFNEDGD